MQRDEAERKLDGVCSNCKQVRRQLKIVQAKRKDLVDSAKARCQREAPRGFIKGNLNFQFYFQFVFLRYLKNFFILFELP